MTFMDLTPIPGNSGLGFNTRGVKNRNPGNIAFGPWAQAHGAVGSAGLDTGHGVAVFPSYEDGLKAMHTLALNKYNSGRLSADALIAGQGGWTPGNHQAAANVAKWMGLGPNDDLRLSDPARMAAFSRALSIQELGPEGARYIQDQLRHSGGTGSAPASPTTPSPRMAFAPTEKKPDNPALNAINNAFHGNGGSGGGASIPLNQTDPEEEKWNRMGNFGNGLLGLGAALMSINNPTGAAALAGIARQNKMLNKWHFGGQTNDGTSAIMVNEQGDMKVVPLGIGPKMTYKGIDTDKDGNTYDTWVAPDGTLKREPSSMQDPNFKKPEEIPAEDAKFWADYVLADPQSLKQVPSKLRTQVMSEVRQLAEQAGFAGKDLYSTVLQNSGNLADEKRRSQIIAQLDTFKGEFFAGAKLVAQYSKELERKFPMVPIEQLYQWAEKNTGAPEADKIVKLKTALEGLSRGYNRAMSTASGGNVTGEDRMTKLLNPAMPHSQITAALQSLTSDVINVNEFAKQARENQRLRNAGKPVKYPALENEDEALKQILGMQPQQAPQAAPAAPQAPQAAAPKGLPEGAKQAPDGNFYVQKDGKWYKVVPK